MFLEIKRRIDSELQIYARQADKLYFLNKISPIFYKNMREFILREGKRVRPTLFVIGYLGFAKKAAPLLYRSAISIELLHDFMLIHDDIIDKSATRRGKPSMHTMLGIYLQGHKKVKFNGQDLAIVSGDIIYAMALDAFLAIKEDLQRKEKALKLLIKAALYTGSGEFIELMLGVRDIEQVSKEDIFRIYDLKTANYTFSSPLAIGATLAGAKKKEIDLLFKYGIYLGRAFQIKDDIIGLFSSEKKIGKSNLTDLQEAKNTLLIWYAFNKSNRLMRAEIKKILSKKNVLKPDLLRMRRIIVASGALDYAKNEVSLMIEKARELIGKSKMLPKYKTALNAYSQKILSV